MKIFFQTPLRLQRSINNELYYYISLETSYRYFKDGDRSGKTYKLSLFGFSIRVTKDYNYG